MTDEELERSLAKCGVRTSPELDTRILSVAEWIVPAEERETRIVRAKWKRRGVFTMAAVLAFGLAVAFRLLYPAESWAQVQQALRGKPWILAAYVDPDGAQHEDWCSLTRDVSAMRHGDFVRFHDHRLKVVYEYDLREKTVSRSLERADDGKREFGLAFDRLLQQIFRGDEKLEFGAEAKIEIVEQKRQPVAKHGRAWQSYELVVRGAGDLPEDQNMPVRLMFLVDPETHLPQFLTMSAAARVPPADAPPPAEFTITYPDKGPIDIYDLGVPRDAKLVDRVPRDDVRQLIAGIRASAERFEPYRALNVISDADAPWYVGTPYVVWRNGSKSRMVFGMLDEGSPVVEPPPADADQRQWWKAQWKSRYGICIELNDGKKSWSNEARPAKWDEQANKPHPITWKQSDFPPPKWQSHAARSWPAEQAPLHLVYPQNLVNFGARRLTPEIHLDSIDGPPGTVKVILRQPSSEERYWIDPERGHMAVRYEMAHRDQTKGESELRTTMTAIVDSAERSPGGIWYPTVQRLISFIEETGQPRRFEIVTRHYLDFDVKFSDDLFKPAQRPGEPLE